MKQDLILKCTINTVQYTKQERESRKTPKSHDKLAKIRSEAKNWSVDVLFTAATDFHEKIFFSIFLQKYDPKIKMLTKFSEDFEIWRKLFCFLEKSQKIFPPLNQLEHRKTRLLTYFEL